MKYPDNNKKSISFLICKNLISIILFIFCFTESFKPQDFNSFDKLFNPLPKGFNYYRSDMEMSNNSYNGRIIGKKYEKLLNATISEDNYAGKFYALYKFDYSTNYKAYIIREPSQYYSTRINLYLYDKKEKEMLSGVELADSFGDEGWSFDSYTCLLDLNNDKYLDIITFRVDRETDGTKKQTINGFIWNGYGFIDLTDEISYLTSLTNIDELTDECINTASLAQQYYRKPTVLGGGGNSFVGFTVPAVFNEKGRYKLTAEVISNDRIVVSCIGLVRERNKMVKLKIRLTVDPSNILYKEVL